MIGIIVASNELLLATEYLEKEKKIPREVLIDAIEAALITAYKRTMIVLETYVN